MARVSFTFAGSEPLRGDRALRQHYPQVDRELALKMLKEGRIWKGNKVARLADTFAPGEKVHVDASADRLGPARVTPYTVLHEIPGVVVVDKAAGVAMHEGGLVADGDGDDDGGSDIPLSRLLNEAVALEVGFPGVSFLGRIDRATSGIVVAATARSSSKILHELWSADVLRKSYLTVVHGKTDDEGVIDIPLAARRGARKGTGVIEEAVTTFVRLAHGEGLSVLRATLETGRTHQIRRHMKAIGHPVVGDARYGDARRDAKRKSVDGLMLHSWCLAHDDEMVASLLPHRTFAPWPSRVVQLLNANGIDAAQLETQTTRALRTAKGEV